MELHDFLIQYYELFSDLEINRAQLSEEFYVASRKLLLNQFDQATKIWLDEQELEFCEKRFKLKFDVANYTPRRRWLFWWNRKAKALLKQYRAELERYLAEISKDTRDTKADKTALDELPAQSSIASPTTLPAPTMSAKDQPPAPPSTTP